MVLWFASATSVTMSLGEQTKIRLKNWVIFYIRNIIVIAGVSNQNTTYVNSWIEQTVLLPFLVNREFFGDSNCFIPSQYVKIMFNQLVFWFLFNSIDISDDNNALFLLIANPGGQAQLGFHDESSSNRIKEQLQAWLEPHRHCFVWKHGEYLKVGNFCDQLGF